MKLTIIGCGDAFGSGGRLNTCFHVAAGETSFLIDCGATSLPALKARGIDRNGIGFILITHFHADHFGGIPFFILDAQFFSKRTAPLIIAGPRGLQEWFPRAMETAFPGSATAKRKFEIILLEIDAGRQIELQPVLVTPRPVRHGPPEVSCYAYRIEHGGRVIAYTGDTEWTDALIDAGRNADLLIAQAYFYEKAAAFHLDYKTLSQNLPRIGAKRVLLTHMNEDMLAHASDVPEEKAYDGLTLTVR
ncbi:MAG: MBL fold metallo-hydrolase [Rhodomicrobium sp.]